MSDRRAPRPAQVCERLLLAMQASEGRRRRRRRDTTPDALGMEIKLRLLRDAVTADPDPEAFEGWLLERALAVEASGPVRAMALAVLAEWRLAWDSDAFRSWLAAGAPSDDAGSD